MEDVFKIIGSLIVLSLVLSFAFNLIDSFITYSRIKEFSNTLESFSLTMHSLKALGSYGSFKKFDLIIPQGYSLFFNNYSNVLEIHGLEEFNLTFNTKVLYSLNLSNGVHEINLYFGPIIFSELKNETVVFV
jgi:hypothetical protein